MDTSLLTLVSVMKALSDPGRITALKLLEIRPLCVSELTDALGLSQPTVSKHLKILENAGLVEACRKGQWVEYSLSSHAPKPFAQSMLANLERWLDNTPELEQQKSRIPLLPFRGTNI